MRAILTLFWLACVFPVDAQVVDSRTPAEVARDDRKAIAAKEKLSHQINYAQVAEALRSAIAAHPLEDGVNLSSARTEIYWDWQLKQPDAEPKCGDWSVRVDRNWWGTVKTMHFTVSYDPTTKKIDPNADGYVQLDFEVQRSKGKLVVRYKSTDHHVDLIILSPFCTAVSRPASGRTQRNPVGSPTIPVTFG